MVKTDVGRDYYGDLEILSTASEEEIKRAFRTLAKVYHPDRNAGKEVDVVPKFQAVQAAYEVLVDPEQKRKYDAERARSRMSAPNLPRRNNVPPPHSSFAKAPSAFPPPPRRTGPTATGPTTPRPNPFAGYANNPSRARQTQPTPPPPTPPRPPNSTAETYAAFAKLPKQRDNTDEQKRKRDAFRGFQKMAPGQSPTGESFAAPPPPRTTPRHPTAPRTSTYTPKSAGAANYEGQATQGWEKFEQSGRKTTTGAEASTGFSGTHRAPNTRKQGFMPSTPVGDEPAAPRSSAYASYARGERPQSSQAQSYFTDHHTQNSPLGPAARPPVSPLRHSRSSNGLEDERRSDRPNLERVSTRYHGIGGERTDVKGAPLSRSASVRNSPVTAPWDTGPNGLHHSQTQDPQPRPRNASPMQRRPQSSQREDSYSESSSGSSSEEEIFTRPKKTPHTATLNPASADSRSGAAFAGQFPGTSYVQGPPARNTDGTRTAYRPQPPPRSRPVSQAAFNYVPSYAKPAPPGGGSGNAGPAGPGGPDMYDPFHFYSRTRPLRDNAFPLHVSERVPSLKAFPLWAVPSSVLPPSVMPRNPTAHPCRTGRSDIAREMKERLNPRTSKKSYKTDAADSNFDCSKGPNPDTSRPASHQDGGPRDSAAKEGFPAAEWNETFSGAGDYFRPPMSPAGRKSPIRSGKTRSKSYNPPSSKSSSGPESAASVPPGISKPADPGAAFVPGTFSTEEWSEKLKYQAAAKNREGEPVKGARQMSRGPSERSQSVQFKSNTPLGRSNEEGTREENVNKNDDVDPMDLDDSMNVGEASKGCDAPEGINPAVPQPAAKANENGLNLGNLANTAPLKPSGTGLGDLHDLGTTLPTEARASAVRPTDEGAHKIGFAAMKALKLPNPPKDVQPPLNVTQDSWGHYIQEMTVYLRDWSVFNKQMLDHFQARQAQMEMTLAPNWLTAVGDGPSGAEIAKSIQEHPDGRLTQRAGFAAYQQWIEEDKLVRVWWESACDHHEQVIANLGRFREMIKPLATR